MRRPRAELDTVFGDCAVGPMPDGNADGEALIATGTPWARLIGAFIRVFVWQGKIFDAPAGFLKNKLTPFGIRAVPGRLYQGPSWFDDKECIVLDYSRTSLVAFLVRDELRQVKHPLYLGKVFLGRKALFHFTLEFRDAGKNAEQPLPKK
jgi:hypothetical protein